MCIVFNHDYHFLPYLLLFGYVLLLLSLYRLYPLAVLQLSPLLASEWRTIVVVLCTVVVVFLVARTGLGVTVVDACPPCDCLVPNATSI